MRAKMNFLSIKRSKTLPKITRKIAKYCRAVHKTSGDHLLMIGCPFSLIHASSCCLNLYLKRVYPRTASLICLQQIALLMLEYRYHPSRHTQPYPIEEWTKDIHTQGLYLARSIPSSHWLGTANHLNHSHTTFSVFQRIALTCRSFHQVCWPSWKKFLPSGVNFLWWKSAFDNESQ